jgi:hypothetical protein
MIALAIYISLKYIHAMVQSVFIYYSDPMVHPYKILQ